MLSVFYFLFLKLIFLHHLFFGQSIGIAFLAFLIGYTGHLFADLFTEMGVPLLFPLGYHFGIPPDPLGKIRIKTGYWFENLIIYPAVNIILLIIIYIYIRNYGLIQSLINRFLSAKM